MFVMNGNYLVQPRRLSYGKLSDLIQNIYRYPGHHYTKKEEMKNEEYVMLLNQHQYMDAKKNYSEFECACSLTKLTANDMFVPYFCNALIEASILAIKSISNH